MNAKVGQNISVLILILWSTSLIAQAPDHKGWLAERSTWQGSIKKGTPIEVHNLFGDVRLRGTKELLVGITANSQMKKDDAHKLTISHQQKNGRLVITVNYAGKDEETYKKNGKRRMDITVLIPHGSTLKVRTHKGLIQAKGIVGDIDYYSDRGRIYSKNKGHVMIGSRQGHITAALLLTNWKKPAKIESRLGDIEVHLPIGQSLSIQASTAGQITTDYSITIKDSANSKEKIAHAKIGEGKHFLNLKNQKGAIKILKQHWLK